MYTIFKICMLFSVHSFFFRLAGSYKALSGGRTGDALVDFTGGVNEFVELRTLFGHTRDEVDSPNPEEEEKRRTLFKVGIKTRG